MLNTEFPTIAKTGSSLPAAAAVGFLKRFHIPGIDFPPPDAVHEVRISPISGMRYDPADDRRSISELFPKGDFPPEDTWHSATDGTVDSVRFRVGR